MMYNIYYVSKYYNHACGWTFHLNLYHLLIWIISMVARLL